jgi:5-oxoprolinase (ATP-hydrolysing)
MPVWEFSIDVGGTFTDCIARTPAGELRPIKVLSSGATKGQVAELQGTNRLVDPLRTADPENFWPGYEIRFLDERGQPTLTTKVAAFHRRLGVLEVATLLPPSITAGTRYELSAGEEAPILAIRAALGLRREEPIPPVNVRLGTTRGTNALLTRRGARTVFVTTRGFADVLLIANQDRPRLFDLDIQKPEPLFTDVVEIDERLDADGRVLQSPDDAKIRGQLAPLLKDRPSLAICLLHSFANPAHEHFVERIARELGFTEISVSSRLAPLIKIVSRGDTTVMDAYLNPILREYVGRLREQLSEVGGRKSEGGTEGKDIPNSEFRIPNSQLKLMTSAGGLIDADRFVGKDSILSGPAGGVIGFSRVAQQAGFDKAIGFDMGGTSTDVSRFDGEYEYEFETKKAGVRIVAPMLAIETVAAGGGSICDFDGVKLVVGPQSAGSDPGPACYGRGGPMTVTDVNLWLGRIVPSRFPFPLDRDAVERRLTELAVQVDGSADQLADGLCRIANANMVRAIRKISVARGYDPAEYVLVCFGGAGAQHACEIADSLGMRRVLIHPLASLLSAYGIGLADVRRFGERSVLQPYSVEQLAELEQLFVELEQAARNEVAAEGVTEQRIKPAIRSLDLRYAGVEATIRVICPLDGDYAARYEELHRQLYGYIHSGRKLEITAARVEVVGLTTEPLTDSQPLVTRRPVANDTQRAWFGDQFVETPVFFREHLHPGDEIHGQALISEPSSTIVVDAGWLARVLNRGEVVLEAIDEKTVSRLSAVGDRQSADPVLLEIFNNLFASIAEQMGVTLQKTSCSTNVKERLDFSCAIFDPEGNLVVNAPHIPVHLGAMSETVKRIIADNPDEFADVPRPSGSGQGFPRGPLPDGRGTVFVTNDPYRGGSHLPDVTVVTPVRDATTGELIFFTASRAHHAEIGGILPGSMPPFSKNLGEEGVLIRNFKLVDHGVSREDELKSLLLSGTHPTRSVNDNLADIRAQVAANNIGVNLLRELVEKQSLDVVQAYMRHIQAAAARKMRLALASLPDGQYQRVDHLDDGSPIQATITIAGDSAAVDFTGTGPVLKSNLNANRAIVTAAVMYVFRCLINEDIPLNGGVLEPVTIVLSECLLNPPEHADPAQCAAVVGGNVETSQRVVDVLLGALGLAAASQGTMNNLTFGDATFGYYETICGGSGATPNANGSDAVHTHMTNTRLTDAEVIERRYPVRVHEFSIRRGSGGGGAHRGGDGIVRRIEFLKPVNVSLLTERRGPFPPFGLNGGQPGSLGRNTLVKAGTPEAIDLGGKAQITVQPGDVLTIETPGGGGCGL